MNEIIRAAAELQGVCESHGWRFCFIGGLAVERWGQPRETVDVDMTLLTGFGDEEGYIRTLLAQFEPRVEEAAEFAMRHRVVLVRAPSGVGLDISLGGFPSKGRSSSDRACSCIRPTSLCGPARPRA